MQEIRELSLSWDLPQITAFLTEAGLRLEPDLTNVYGVFEGEELLACGGIAAPAATIKCVAVRADRRGENLLNTLISHLYTTLRRGGVKNTFVVTKPENEQVFLSLGFFLVARGETAAMFESDRRGIAGYVSSLQARGSKNPPLPAAAVVINANPFTLGHQYLLTKAAAQCGTLHVFVVEEDQSVFPFADRLALIEKGSAHLPNVVVHPGGPYMISAATFPSYFIKDPAGAAPAHAQLDATLFAQRIAPALCITARFLGEEPLDPLTRLYNETLLAILPPQGISVNIIKRRLEGDAPISASRVRACIKAGDWTEVKALVPQTTWEYFSTNAGKSVIARIQGGHDNA